MNSNQAPKKLKIFCFSHSSGIYGAEKSFLTVLKNYDRSRYELIVISREQGPLLKEFETLNIKNYMVSFPKWITGFPASRFNNLKNLKEEWKAQKQLKAIIKSEKPDIIYTNTMVVFAGAVTAAKYKIPHIWHIREILPNNPDFFPVKSIENTIKYVTDHSDTIISISNATATQFQGSLSSKIRIIYDSVEFPESSHNNSPENKLKLLYMGSIIKRKGIDTLINALAEIKNRSLIPVPTSLTIVGEGRYRKNLEELAKKLKISDCITFAGQKETVLDYIKNSHILLVPSHQEPWGRVVIEALLSGLPVIGANAGGILESISDHQTGLLAEPGNIEQWTEKILWTFNNYATACQYAENGKKYAKNKFSLENYITNVQNTFDLYKK